MMNQKIKILLQLISLSILSFIVIACDPSHDTEHEHNKEGDKNHQHEHHNHSNDHNSHDHNHDHQHGEGHAHDSHSHEEHGHNRQHGAHVHGLATLNVVIESNTLEVELFSPAYNIIGFEHKPRNPEQEKTISDAVQLLEKFEALFTLAPEAKCSITHSHAHQHSGGSTGHSDFHATYKINCEKIDQLKTLGSSKIFKTFANIEKLEVQIITPKQQTAATLTADSSEIKF